MNILNKTVLLNIDIIVLATGYKESFNFFNKKYSHKRFLQIINPELPKCGFIGLSPSYNWLKTSYKQSEWFINHYMKHHHLFTNILAIKKMKDSIKKYDLGKQKLNLDYHDLTYELFKY